MSGLTRRAVNTTRRALLSLRRRRMATGRFSLVALIAFISVFSLNVQVVFGYQAGATGGQTWTTPSGLSVTGSGSADMWPGPASMSSRNYNHGAGTYVLADGFDVTSSINGQMGVNWTNYGTGCSMPGANATTTGCSQGSITLTFSQPVLNPVLNVNDIGGAFDAGCMLGISGRFTASFTSPSGSVSMSKTSTATGNGAALLSGTTIYAPAIPADTYQGNHANGSFLLTGLVSSVTFNETVDIKKTGSGTCSYGNSNLDYLEEQITMNFSLQEDYGDGPATYDSAANGGAASNIIGDLKLGSTISQDFAHTINTGSNAVTSSTTGGNWSANANGDTDDAISSSSLVSGTQKLSTGIMLGSGYSLTVPISGAGTGNGALKAGNLCGYIDLNNDGKYTTSSPNESACATYAAGAKTATLNWTGAQWPAGATAASAVGLRLRTAYGAAATLAPNALLASGETEDYLIELLPSVPPTADALAATNSQGVTQVFTPTVSAGSLVAANTCIVSGGTCVSSLVVPGEGTWTVNGDGSISFAPLSSFTGTATPITYRVSDSAAQTSTATITATVVAAPTVQNDSSVSGVNQAQSVNVLTNDSAAAGSGGFASSNPVALCTSGSTVSCTTGSSFTVAGQGTYTVASNGTITFTPVSGYTGTPTPVTYVVTDALGGKSVATYQPTVVAAPTATNNTSTGTAGATQSVNVKVDDTAASGQSISSISLCTSGSTTSCTTGNTITNANGAYTLDPATGVIGFVPAAGFTGTATAITYVITDSLGSKAVATFTPTVVAAPTAVADTTTGGVNQTQSKDLLANDTAASGATKDASLTRLCGVLESAPACTQTSVTTAAGTYTLSGGTVTFTPAFGYTGTPPAMPYVVVDSLGGKTSSTFTATVVGAPALVADTQSGLSGATQTKNLLTNDAAQSGATLTASSIKLCGASELPPACSQTSVTNSAGTYNVNSSGVVTFVPASGFSGQAPAISYQVTDSLGSTSSTNFTATVLGTPTATAETGTAAWGTDVVLTPRNGDTAGYGTTLNSGVRGICATTVSDTLCTGTTVSISGQGTYTLNNDGTVTFHPLASFTGTATPIKYSIIDNQNQIASATLTSSVNAPAVPGAGSESKTVLAGHAVTFTPITSGSAPLASGSQLNTSTATCLVATANTTPATGCVSSLTTADGSWSINASTGIVTYTANNNAAAGDKIAVSYRVTDVTGQTATAALTPVIPPAPTASADVSRGAISGTQYVSVLGNDAPGASSANLDVTSVKLCAVGENAPCTRTTVTVAGEGTYTVLSNGVVKFVPITAYSGTATTLSYTVADNLGQQVSSTLTVTVVPPPFPIPAPDTSTAAYGQSITFRPGLNDNGGVVPAGASEPAPSVVPSSIKLCAAGQSAPNCTATSITTGDGTYVLNTATGEVVFTPANGFAGTATSPVTYQITNNWTGLAGPGTATSILMPTIAPPGAPMGVNDSVSTSPNAPVTVNPVTNDTNGSGTLTASTLRLCSQTELAPSCAQTIVTVRGGTFTVNTATGEVAFVPSSDFDVDHPAVVTYVIQDSLALWTNAVITITDPPAITPATIAADLAYTGMHNTGPAPLGGIFALVVGIGITFYAAAKKRAIEDEITLARQNGVLNNFTTILNRTTTVPRTIEVAEEHIEPPARWKDGRPD